MAETPAAPKPKPQRVKIPLKIGRSTRRVG
jgi:hypothetical protein